MSHLLDEHFALSRRIWGAGADLVVPQWNRPGILLDAYWVRGGAACRKEERSRRCVREGTDARSAFTSPGFVLSTLSNCPRASRKVLKGIQIAREFVL